MKKTGLCSIRMMRSFFVFLMLSLLMSAGSADGDFEIQGTLLIRYNGQAEEVTIPDGIEIIGEGAFLGSDIKKIMLPDTVKSLRNNCFSYCEQLEEITLPASVTEIGNDVFYGCRTLKTLSSAPGIRSRAPSASGSAPSGQKTVISR